MKKNKRHSEPTISKATPAAPLLSRQSLIFIAAGLLTLIVGYIVLSFADSTAQNLPGQLSPFLILGGYALVGVGLWKNKTTPTNTTDKN